MKSGRNYNALDAMKFVASLFVVGIHVHPFGDFSGKADYLFIVLARFAVPFFFVTSGFLLFKRLKSEENPNRYVKSYVMRILKMYLFWFIVGMLQECGAHLHVPRFLVSDGNDLRHTACMAAFKKVREQDDHRGRPSFVRALYSVKRIRGDF